MRFLTSNFYSFLIITSLLLVTVALAEKNDKVDLNPATTDEPVKNDTDASPIDKAEAKEETKTIDVVDNTEKNVVTKKESKKDDKHHSKRTSARKMHHRSKAKHDDHTKDETKVTDGDSEKEHRSKKSSRKHQKDNNDEAVDESQKGQDKERRSRKSATKQHDDETVNESGKTQEKEEKPEKSSRKEQKDSDGTVEQGENNPEKDHKQDKWAINRSRKNKNRRRERLDKINEPIKSSEKVEFRTDNKPKKPKKKTPPPRQVPWPHFDFDD